MVGQRLPGVLVNDIAQQQCLDWRPAKGGFLAEPLNAGADAKTLSVAGFQRGTMILLRHFGLLCCSMYCLRIDKGAPPHEMMQYDRDQNTGLR